MDKATYEQHLLLSDKIDKLKFNRYDKLIQFTRHILTISFGLLGILVAFKPEDSQNHHHHILFSGVLISIGLSCLLGLVFLHHVIDEHNQLLTFYKEKRADVLNGDLINIATFSVNKKWHYEWAKYGFYSTSIISLTLLIVYGILN